MGPHTCAGAVHVHTAERSDDARVPFEEILRQATALGLAFLVVADHDAPAMPPVPFAAWHGSILVVRAVEWSSADGHLMDLSAVPGKGPFPWSADAVADCRQRGGPCVVTHPTSWRRQWLSPVLGLDGMEIHSAMTATGDLLRPPFGALAWLAWRAVVHPGLALADAGASQDTARDLFEAYAQAGLPFAATCGADVHGHLPVRENLLAFLTLAGLRQPLDRNPQAAAVQLTDALMNQAACVNATTAWVDGLALTESGGVVSSRACVRGAHGSTQLVLHRNGAVVAQADLTQAPGSGCARVRAPAEADGTWRAAVQVKVDLPWGPRVYEAATRYLRVEDTSNR